MKMKCSRNYINGTIETSEEEDNTIKNVTVWNLNNNEENPE